MNSLVPSPIFLSLADVMRSLRVAVAAWGGRGVLGPVLLFLLHRRIGEIGRRIAGIVLRFEAGRVLRRSVSVRGAEVIAVRRSRGKRVWPGRFGWLVQAAGFEAAGFRSQLQAVLETPEMVALLAAVPQARRVLRPLCRMLAVEVSVLRPAMTVMAGGGVAVGVGWAGDVQAILEGGVVSGLGAPLVRNV